MWKILHNSVFQEISPVFMQSSNFHSKKHRIYTSCIYLKAHCMMHQKYLTSVHSPIYYTWTHVRYCVLLLCFFSSMYYKKNKLINCNSRNKRELGQHSTVTYIMIFFQYMTQVEKKKIRRKKHLTGPSITKNYHIKAT